MKAEVFRELGQFRDCTTLLANPFKDPEHSRITSFIKELAENEIGMVREIPKEEKPSKPNAGDSK